jgi:hypothetical protein
MPLLCCLYRLKEDADKDAWDDFIREHDIPLTVGLPSVVSYQVYRIGERLEGAAVYDYLELLEFSTSEDLERDMAGETWAAGMEAVYGHGLAEEVCFLVDAVAL